MTAPVVSLRAAGAALGRTRALHDVDLDVAAGEWLGVIGPNGAGKTTLLRCLAGLVKASGHVVVDGVRPGAVPARELARRVAYVPQSPHLPQGMTVGDYVLLGRTPHVAWFGVERAADFAVVAEVLAALELVPLASRPLDELSGGEGQRAVLARALAQQGQVLLLDEPTRALDLGHQHAVLELVDRLRRERGLTVVAVVHDLTLAGQFPDRLLVLNGGRPVAAGTPEEVLTEDLVREHWGVAATVVRDPGGAVTVVPRRQGAPGPVHA
ncbi:MAG TPA: ABC transporter ATP-binding protein [Acidimicrobiales bacterium]|nr:ABC transporter ATP-binding protein [Acidimicrobiales bacterium]